MEKGILTEDKYKVVNVSFSETASIVIKADTNDQAEELLWENFTHIPDLRVISIEDADPEIVADLKAQREQDDDNEDLEDVSDMNEVTGRTIN